MATVERHKYDKTLLNKTIEKKYFCVLCGETFITRDKCETHLKQHFINCETKEEEKDGIELWIDRHLRYQDSLVKSMSLKLKTVPDRSKTLYRGCPVCDCIIRVYDIRNDPYSDGLNTYDLVIRDINTDYSGNNVNHINPHLRYYPYECVICDEEYKKIRQKDDIEIKEVFKTAVKPMMRIHIKDKHFKHSTLERDVLEEKIDKSIKSLKVTKLENIGKKQNIVRMTTKAHTKRKSVPGPLREPRVEPVKRLRPLIPIHLSKTMITTKLNDIKDIINQKSYYIPIIIDNPSVAQVKKEILSLKVNPIKEEIKSRAEELNTSSDEFSDSELKSLRTVEHVFGCIFCYKKFKNYKKAFDHYLRHCNVLMGCAKCELKFTNIAHFRQHDSTHNENINLLNLNEFKLIRKWVQNFLSQLTNKRQELIEMCCDLTKNYCPVCIMFAKVFKVNTRRELGSDESIEIHIHNHLSYFPYECIDCCFKDIKTEFCLNSSAKKHLLEKHDIKNANSFDLKELNIYYIRNNSINRFDKIIEKCVEITNQMNDFWIINSKDQTLNSV